MFMTLRGSEWGSWRATPRNIIKTLLLLQLWISWRLGGEPRLEQLKHAFIPPLLIFKVHLPILHAEAAKEIFKAPVLPTLAPYRWWETVRELWTRSLDQHAVSFHRTDAIEAWELWQRATVPDFMWVWGFKFRSSHFAWQVLYQELSSQSQNSHFNGFQ